MTGNNLLTDNTLKNSVVVSDHNAKLVGHFQNLVGRCPVTDCYFQDCSTMPVLTLHDWPLRGETCVFLFLIQGTDDLKPN